MRGLRRLEHWVRAWAPRRWRNALDRAVLDLERFHPPQTPAAPPGRRPLLLAPHPDDESIACGGTLARYARQGVPVHVVFLTDGRLGDPAVRAMPQGSARRAAAETDLAARRQQEARAALQVLGVAGHDFLEAPDGALATSLERVVPPLAALLDRLRPDVVLLPFVTDRHADHAAATSCLLAAAERMDAGWTEAVDCLGYEVWSPIYANLLIDIGEVAGVKRRAIACHASQLKDVDYLAGVEGLNRYRGIQGGVPGGAAEAFFRAPLPVWRSLHDRLCR